MLIHPLQMLLGVVQEDMQVLGKVHRLKPLSERSIVFLSARSLQGFLGVLY
jgi:hypothetical protein